MINIRSVPRKFRYLLEDINSLEKDFRGMTDNELKAKSFQLKSRYELEKDLNPLIAEAFALTREASLRTLGLRHFDVQLWGGLVLNDQSIAEMKTGEGKTLVATLPAFLNGITGKGVHIITVNEYLANRDQISMGQIYRFLGLYTGLVLEGMEKAEKRDNYAADITYLTNSQVGFDYLYDNMALELEEIVLRPFYYGIIDEVDSVLIDEAQTPLVVSNNLPTLPPKYIKASEAINYLELNRHYKVDEKERNVTITEAGSELIEQLFETDNLYDTRNPWIPFVINALRASALFTENVHYIIQNQRLVIIDEFTGRLMPDRRWGDGLHQAVEAKERLPISNVTETAASITYQNFFLLYPKLSGMSGTAQTARIEFEKIYNLNVRTIGTAKPSRRKDLPDAVYRDQFLKWNAVAQTCRELSTTGQPILIGTKTVEKSELLAQLLSEYQLPYQILNAKAENVRKESEIVAQAGQQNSITIATNMAGRGTDIILGGNINFRTQRELYDLLTLMKRYRSSKTLLESDFLNQWDGNSQRVVSVLLSLLNDEKFLELSDVDVLQALRENDRLFIPRKPYEHSIQFLISTVSSYHKKQQRQENQIVKNLGGLYIIGTERNDSRRIDDQLRGRAGRQGDPGTTKFFLSLDDSLFRLFGGSAVQRLAQSSLFDDGPLELNFLSSTLDTAQTRMEERAYQVRKSVFDYDAVLNMQRKMVYEERRKHLYQATTKRRLLTFAEQAITGALLDFQEKNAPDSTILEFCENLLGRKLLIRSRRQLKSRFRGLDLKVLQTIMVREFWLVFSEQEREACFDQRFQRRFKKPDPDLETLRSLQRGVILNSLDQSWRRHLQNLALLRDNVGWRSYGQQNPLQEYRREALYDFKAAMKSWRLTALHELLRVSVL